VSLNDILSTDTGRKQRRRIGRGLGSGLGKTGGRGGKGEGSRTGGTNKGPLFEGGQFPFWKRLPYRGFTNFAHRVQYLAVDLGRALERVKGNDLSLDALIKAGLAKEGQLIKICGKAEVKRAVKVSVHRMSGPAKAAVEAAGGSVTELALIDKDAAKA
jgi:large subunit ribosomal protein L15